MGINISFNWLSINGKKNIVYQGSDGKKISTTIDEIIHNATSHVEEKVRLLEVTILDKDKIIGLTEFQVETYRRDLEAANAELAGLEEKIRQLTSLTSDVGYKNLSPDMQSAWIMALSGNFGDAVNKLEGLDIEAEKYLREAEKLKRRELELYSAFVFKATLLFIEGDWVGAKHNIESSLKIHKSAKAFLESAQMLSVLEDYELSSQYVKSAMRLAESPIDQISILIYKAIRSRAAHDLSGMFESLSEADNLLANIEKTEESIELSLQVNLAFCEHYRIADNTMSASIYLNKAVETSEVLLKSNPDKYLQSIASLHKEAGQYLIEVHQLDRAIERLAQALELYTRGNRVSGLFIESIVGVNNLLGIAYRQKNQYQGAIKHYQLALAGTNEINRPILAKQLESSVLNNLSSMYIHLGRRDDAEHTLERAVKLRRELVVTDVQTGEKYLADSLINLGTHDMNLGKLQEAEKVLLEAKQIYRAYNEKNSNKYLSLLASCGHNLGMTYSLGGKLEDAQDELVEVVRIRCALVEKGEKNMSLYTQDLYLFSLQFLRAWVI